MFTAHVSDSMALPWCGSKFGKSPTPREFMVILWLFLMVISLIFNDFVDPIFRWVPNGPIPKYTNDVGIVRLKRFEVKIGMKMS